MEVLCVIVDIILFYFLKILAGYSLFDICVQGKKIIMLLIQRQLIFKSVR